VRRRDVVLATAAGVAVALLVGLAPTVLPSPILAYVVAPALDFWFLGIAAVVISFFVRHTQAWHGVARVLGVVGVAWLAFAVAFYVLLVIVFIVFRPIV
jgi:hypothetical protein